MGLEIGIGDWDSGLGFRLGIGIKIGDWGLGYGIEIGDWKLRVGIGD